MQCTIEIFKNGGWQACCIITVDNPAAGPTGPSAITFSQNALSAPAFAPSLRYRPQAGTLILPHWPGFLLDLIPQGEGRQYLLDVLELPDGPESDWRLLLMGAINPIGQLRVREAAEAYHERMRQLDPKWSETGFTTEAILARSDAFIAHFDAHGLFSAGATSVQGLSPKLLLTQGRDGLWYADATLPDSRAAKHIILKLSRARNIADWTILQHEAAYMRLAREMGLHVAALPTWQNDMLFVPRFDRSVTPDGVIRHPQESLASLAGLTDPQMPATHNRILETVRQFVDHPHQATLEYLKRDILNLALGNTDNSPYNTAIQTVNGETRLTPLYDFAPMYLDRDEISRTLEWCDENGNETANWMDVLRSLPYPPAEKETLRSELQAFGKKMEKLEALMQQHGVSEDIMTDRYYGIQNQRWQLREL